MVLIRRIAEKFLTKEIVNLIENSLSEHDFDDWIKALCKGEY